MKHFKHVWNTCKKHLKNTWKAIVKHMEYPDKTLATYIWNICNIQIKHLRNRWNIWNIHLQQTFIAIATCATLRSIFATSIKNTCNILLKQLKYLKHTLLQFISSLRWIEGVIGILTWKEFNLLQSFFIAFNLPPFPTKSNKGLPYIQGSHTMPKFHHRRAIICLKDS
jgi:hypothetical protein